MANFTITVSNSVRCFGAGPSSLWNAYNWAAFKWGEGTADFPHRIVHLISETIASVDTSQKRPRHLISETVTPTGMEIFRILPVKQIFESVSPASEMTSEQVLDGSGYNRVFPGETTDAESRFTPTWTSATADTESWTVASATSTTWSDA